jgi:hypothetical protein
VRRSVTALAGLALVASLVAVPVAMSADGGDPVKERAYVVRTLEDPSITPIPDSGCPGGAGTLFKANGYANSIATRASDGMVVQDSVRRVGVVRTCARVTSIAEGATGPITARINLGGKTYTASGTGRATSVGAPKGGVVLLGAALRLKTGPDGFVGGIATSASLVLLAPVQGLHTGSFWTLRVYSSS